jgi:hypothetical protein
VQFSFVEFENGADLKTAVEKLDKRDFKGATVHCTQDVSAGSPSPPLDVTNHNDFTYALSPTDPGRASS